MVFNFSNSAELKRLNFLLYDSEIKIDKGIERVQEDRHNLLKVDKIMFEEGKKLVKKTLISKLFKTPVNRIELILNGCETTNIIKDHGLEWYPIHALFFDKRKSELIIETQVGTKVVVKVKSTILEIVQLERHTAWYYERKFFGWITRCWFERKGKKEASLLF